MDNAGPRRAILVVGRVYGGVGVAARWRASPSSPGWQTIARLQCRSSTTGTRRNFFARKSYDAARPGPTRAYARAPPRCRP